ncbi:hypothetical protein L798_03176 [Zootermopsis nevadensis]|uniref:Uncharacterized protein n=1 Tax=Zootermopsis nevadensis TaxID=136037 RepID=A0A067RNT0_ZOONE|nr:hypothetical protein L798_03176 [Zootermopsis nevadensis]
MWASYFHLSGLHITPVPASSYSRWTTTSFFPHNTLSSFPVTRHRHPISQHTASVVVMLQFTTAETPYKSSTHRHITVNTQPSQSRNYISSSKRRDFRSKML